MVKIQGGGILRLLKKLLRILPAMFLYGLGMYLSIKANIGLAPWEAFHSGCAKATGISFGNIVLLSGLIILAVVVLLKEKIGLGTVINILLIGKTVDLLNHLHIMPKADSFFAGVGILLAGQFLLSFATYLYISAGLGSGPRDSLMVALGKRLPNVPIGAIRGLIEGTVLFIGWILGAKVGPGTVIAVPGISLIMQFTFRILRFQVRDVRHESIVDTFRNLRKPRISPEY